MIRTWIIGVVVLLAGSAAEVLAALPKSSDQPPQSSPYAAYGIAFLLTVAVCAAAFKHSQRSHLD